MHKITIYDYLAYSDPNTQQAVMDLIRSRGYQINPRTDEDLANDIMAFVNYEGFDSGMKDLATVHPDRDLILQSAGKLGADGDTNPDLMNMRAIKGMTTPAAVTPVAPSPAVHHNNTPIIAGLMAVVVLGIIAIIVKR